MRSETVSELMLADDSPAQIRKAVFPGAVRSEDASRAPGHAKGRHPHAR